MTATTLSPVATRFAWKEYRTLRGFWIAAFVLGVLVQWFVLATHARPPSTGWSTDLFVVALCTSALYAVGVAATTFSMEHEDETYSFLIGLPARWLPIFAGKLSFALASAVVLAGVLTIVGYLTTGGALPGLAGTALALGAFGFLIVEALAWGTFFSLTLRQPLLAAILAIAAVSASLTVLTSTFVEGNLSSLSIDSYIEVLPQRIALVASVLLIDLLVARRWINLDRGYPQSAPPPSEFVEPDNRRARALARMRSRFRPAALQHAGLRMFGRLAWQTCRHSWRWMLGLPAIGLLLCAVMYFVTYGLRLYVLTPEDQIAIGPFVILLAVGGLYGCGVFLADQRGRSYRFLAEHAAWPRSVWWSRQLVWLLPIAIALSLVMVWAWMSSTQTQHAVQRSFVNMWRAGEWHGGFFILDQWQQSGFLLRSMEFAFWGLALGFAIGQAASMFFRRALVAGLAVGMAAVPSVLFAILLWIWELPPWQFLLPIILGLVLATWLRAPDWLVERNTLRAWAKVALALVMPVLFIAWWLPASRQLPPHANGIVGRQILSTLAVPWEDARFLGPAPDFVRLADRWVETSGITKVPQEQAASDRLIRLAELIEVPRKRISNRRQESRVELRQRIEANRQIIDEAAELAGRDYRFPMREPELFADHDPDPIRGRLWELVDLLEDAARDATHDGQLDRALDYLLAGMTIDHRLNFGRMDSWPHSSLELLIEWATAKGQTSSRIKGAISAIDSLQPGPSDANVRERLIDEGFASMNGWKPPSYLTAQYLQIRDLVRGNEVSNLIGPSATWREFAVIYLNSLPFERERALAILADDFADQSATWYSAARLTNQDRLREQARVSSAPRDDRAFHDYAGKLRRLVLDANANEYLGDNLRYNKPPLSWMHTSFLLRQLLERTGPGRRFWLGAFVDTRVHASGLRLQLALLAYRLDHGQFPESLDALAPDYLPFVPIDPYSGRPFEYRPQGLDLKLREIPAGTPLLWSVGAANFHLVWKSVIEPLTENTISGDEPGEIRRDVYELVPSEPYIYAPTPQIFPLPK